MQKSNLKSQNIGIAWPLAEAVWKGGSRLVTTLTFHYQVSWWISFFKVHLICVCEYR